MQTKTLDSANRLKHRESMVARLTRRAEQLEEVSNKYWTARRVIFICGALLSLFACRYAGQTVAWVLAVAFVVGFWVISVYHRQVRDSIARNALMLKLKQVQVARIRLDWDQLPPTLQAPPEPGHP